MECPRKEKENGDVLKCTACHLENKMPYPYCCLLECGEHEFCRTCARYCSNILKGE